MPNSITLRNPENPISMGLQAALSISFIHSIS
jgi:hypothetical protein